MVNSSGKVKQRMADINADIESTISGMKTSKAFDNMDVDYERFEKSNETYKNSKRLLQGYGKIQRFSRILHMYAPGGGDRLRRMTYHGKEA